MSILMVHDENTNSSIALSEGIVGGEHTPVRRYRQDGSFLSVDPPANAREHDLDQLQQLGYRLAAPVEQSEYQRQKRKKTAIQEEAPKGDNK